MTPLILCILAILLLLTLIKSSECMSTLCSETPYDSVCDVCGCDCEDLLRCFDGPPATYSNTGNGVDVVASILLKNNPSSGDSVIKSLTISFTTNLTVEEPRNNEMWTDLEMRTGKHNLITRESR